MARDGGIVACSSRAEKRPKKEEKESDHRLKAVKVNGGLDLPCAEERARYLPLLERPTILLSEPG